MNKQETLKPMGKSKEIGFICSGVSEKCYAVLWSYGEICVGCGCCNKDKAIRRKARLEYWQYWLNHNINFNAWADDKETRAIQEKNVKLGIKEAKIKVKYYAHKCRQEDSHNERA